MNVEEKHRLLEAVKGSGVPIEDALRTLDLPRATYYRWKRKARQNGMLGLKDLPSIPQRPWNRLLSQERDIVLNTALKKLELLRFRWNLSPVTGRFPAIAPGCRGPIGG